MSFKTINNNKKVKFIKQKVFVLFVFAVDKKIILAG